MKNVIKSLVFLTSFLASSSSMANLAATRAQAVLAPTKNNSVRGIITFYQFADGIKVIADVSGLKPGKHGLHIHEWGDCSAPDASSAGNHFNPINERHGAPNTSHHHIGDLGNIVANINGKAYYELVDKNMHLSGRDSIVGRSVIVHMDADDLRNQPSGNSGDRIACGIIGVINPFPEKN